MDEACGNVVTQIPFEQRARMTDDNASILSHVSIGTNDFDRSVMFYDAVLNTLNIKRVLQHPGAVAYGKQFPEFWVQIPHDGGRASTGNGTHFSFLADTKNQVQSFFVAAMANGAVSEGEPGPRSD